MTRILILCFFFFILFSISALSDYTQVPRPVLPHRIHLCIPNSSEMVTNDSRVVEVLWYSGYDNLSQHDFSPVTERDIIWNITPSGHATIDAYGRLETLEPGKIILTAISRSDPSVSDNRAISIVKSPTILVHPEKRVVRSTFVPPEYPETFQKIVEMIPKNSIAKRRDIPEQVKEASSQPESVSTIFVRVNRILWSIEPFADRSYGKYIKRIDESLSVIDRDRIQYFMGNRYLPDNESDPVLIADDQENGLWVVSKSGNLSHIRMIRMTGAQKAEQMSEITKTFVSRMGFASGATYQGNRWIPSITDNDGLWTSMYGAGEMMRSAVVRDPSDGYTQIERSAARESAINALKAVLLLAYISGREGQVYSRFRYLNNTRLGHGNKLSSEYLGENRTYAIENYPGSPAEKCGLSGIDAGKNNSGQYLGGNFKYSLGPLVPADWTIKGPDARSNRTLKGFIARTCSISEVEDTPFDDGLFFRRNPNGSQTVCSQANRLYDFTKDEHPVLNIGDSPLPSVLQDVLTLDGTRYTISDVVYKGDTSTDELIGHLFLYKISYDILDEHNPEEQVLREFIRTAVCNLAQHLIDNGYQLVDATGQGTTWGKTSRDYFTSDFTIEDNSLNCLVLLDTFKLAYYLTGEKKWQDEYYYLATGEGFQYADLAAKYWDHWLWLSENEDSDPDHGVFRLDQNASVSDAERLRHIQYLLNYSDEEMAMLSYYLLFQMETDPHLLGIYQKGLDGWWNSISFSENPLWYYIYQLAYPHERKTDGYGHDLLTTAAWALSRHPVDTTRNQGFIPGSRPDVLDDCGISIRPDIIMGTRTSWQDTKNAISALNKRIFPGYDPKNIYQIIVLPPDERAIHKFNNPTFTDINDTDIRLMEPATTYTLPYWFSRYHHLLVESG